MRAWFWWAAGLVLGQTGCALHATHPYAPGSDASTTWQYDVVPEEGGRDLRVEAWLPRGSLVDLVVRRGALRFIDDVEVQRDGRWRDVARQGAGFHVPECAHGCRLRYRFDLGDAAQALHDTDTAIAWGSLYEAPPSVWLLHPTLAPAGTRYRLHVDTSRVAFGTGVFPATGDAAAGEPDTYEADATNLAAAPYAAFGEMRLRRLEPVPGATVDVAIAPAEFAVDDDAILAWVAASARTMARFFGCFPLERVFVLVVPARGDHVRHGETMGDGGASIVVELGRSADARALADDWVLPHEMAHLAVPSIARRHHWIEEGVAVYVQPIARARAGLITPHQAWRELALGMPQGVPLRVDRGLDDTPGWARTYWGGATFCLLADVDIRLRTHNRFGLEDALRGVLASGGSVAHVWDFGRLLDTADAWVGAPVLRSLDRQMGQSPWTVDLPALLRRLGVVVHGDDVALVDDAPLAAVRRAITEPLPTDAPEPTACAASPPGRLAQR